FLNNAMHLSSMVVLVYDHILTIATEIEHLWLQPKSRVSHVFFLFRYCALIVTIIATVLGLWTAPLEVRSKSPIDVSRLYQFQHKHACPRTQVLIMQRVYAIFEHNRFVLYGLCAYGAVGVAVVMWAAITQKYAASGNDNILKSGTGLRCPVTVSGSQYIATKLTFGTDLSSIWITVMVYDLIVFVMTAYKTFEATRVPHMPLMQLLLRDGAMYFGSMFLLNFVNVLTYYVCDPPPFQGCLVPVVSCVSVTLLSRMMLHLHGARHRQTTDEVEMTTLPWVIAQSGTIDSMLDPNHRRPFDQREDKVRIA
ncbi:hypothetical protein HDZ31DRAFT_41147, partial [Schizophyllum fasciatum]